MSVLNQSGDELVECPLCMEPLEVDDLNFFPCTCGYQICRFCWHRIRTDENGLCPACRKAYSENPADFIPLSQEQVAKLKAEKRQRDQQRKAKLSENRKHLASVRVVQRNLVFVVGLPVRLADPEVLKRHEYFGKFGKIQKVVINQSTSYAGSQGPSASAYVTYLKSDDALRAIQSVNNITIDGRQIKSSLGTTKYCSHFLKNQTCPKSDCMYLHDYGDPEASFTKEEMHVGKHQEYEKKLHESLNMRHTNNNNHSHTATTTTTSSSTTTTPPTEGGKTSSAPIPTDAGQTNGTSKHSSSREANGLSSSVSSSSSTTSSGSERDKKDKDKNKKGKTKTSSGDGNWKDRKDKPRGNKNENRTENGSVSSKLEVKENSKSPSIVENGLPSSDHQQKSSVRSIASLSTTMTTTPSATSFASATDCHLHQNANKLAASVLDDNTSFFSSNTFQKLRASPTGHMNHNRIAGDGNEDGITDTSDGESHPTAILTDTLPNINTTEDWAAAFGFPRPSEPAVVDPLGKREENTPSLNTFRNGLRPFRQDQEFSKGIEPSYIGLYDIPPKVPDNLLDLISSNTTIKKNGYVDHTQQQQQQQPQRVLPIQPIANPISKSIIGPSNGHIHHNNVNFDGLDENMSKFFMNFHKSLKDLNPTTTATTSGAPGLSGPPPMLNEFSNGFNGIHHNSFYSGYGNGQADRLVMLQQKQMEEQFMNLGMKQGFGNGVSNPIYQNGLTQPQNNYVNGENGSGYGHLGGHGSGSLYGGSTSQKNHNVRSSPEDDLGFDPFQETQKAFEELMASENHKLHNTSRNQTNGMVYNNGSHLPPPPPGFVQSNPHMNSFGSKILPYLNMSSGQQQINNSQSPNSWAPNNFTALHSQQQQQQQQQQNSTTNTCNDWKVLDPAILTSSQHYPLANMSTIRDYTKNLNQQQIQNGPPHLRSFDFNTNSPFSNAFTQLQQPNINGYSQHLNTQQQTHLNWFTSADLNSQISSPPGFRTNQATKQQEC